MSEITSGYIPSLKNKITKKLFGVVHLKTKRKKKGNALLSFITVPFTFMPGKSWTDPHPNYFDCTVMANLYLERGYDVDIIDWHNDTFIPKKKYAVCVDLRENLERLSPLLGPECKKVMHTLSSHPKFQNEAEQKRIDALEKRRGIRFSMKRPEKFCENAKFADFIECCGNKSVIGTYGDLAEKIFRLPLPTAELYDFPKNKDFKVARNHFLWFGGGGAILKGLDLAIEAFAKMPEYKITLAGPAPYEKEFEKAYEKELRLPNVKRYPRPVIHVGGNMVGDKKLEDVIKECGAIIFPSASEGGGASVIQAMQAGVIPFVTSSSGISEEASNIIEPSIESITAAVRKVASTDPAVLAKESYRAWQFACAEHSKEMYTKRLGDYIDKVLKL